MPPFQQFVQDGHVSLTLHVTCEHIVYWIERQYALQVDTCGGRLLLDALHNCLYVLRYRVNAETAGEVVDADKQKHLRGLSCCDDVQTVEHAVGGVAADAAVLGMRIAEQLSPLTTVGDAVAQKIMSSLLVGSVSKSVAR